MNEQVQHTGRRAWIIVTGAVAIASIVASPLAIRSEHRNASHPPVSTTTTPPAPLAAATATSAEPTIAPSPLGSAVRACSATARFACPAGTEPKLECVDREVGLDYPYGDDSSPVVFRQTCVRRDDPRTADGPVGEWRENGRRTVAGSLRDGEREGAWTMWFSSGMVAARVSYRRGAEHGAFVAYHFDSRQTKAIGQYRDGLPIGTWRCFDKSGTRTGTAVYSASGVKSVGDCLAE